MTTPPNTVTRTFALFLSNGTDRNFATRTWEGSARDIHEAIELAEAAHQGFLVFIGNETTSE